MNLRPLALVVVLACAKPAPDAAPTAPASAPPSPAWDACKSDAECTFVSLGCCETTPVNRAHAGEMQKKLDASGKAYCPPKTACGPGPDGTWNGTPGVCRNGVCAKP